MINQKRSQTAGLKGFQSGGMITQHGVIPQQRRECSNTMIRLLHSAVSYEPRQSRPSARLLTWDKWIFTVTLTDAGTLCKLKGHNGDFCIGFSKCELIRFKKICRDEQLV